MSSHAIATSGGLTPGARGGEGRELAGEKRACAKTAETCTNEIRKERLNRFRGKTT